MAVILRRFTEFDSFGPITSQWLCGPMNLLLRNIWHIMAIFPETKNDCIIHCHCVPCRAIVWANCSSTKLNSNIVLQNRAVRAMCKLQRLALLACVLWYFTSIFGICGAVVWQRADAKQTRRTWPVKHANDATRDKNSPWTVIKVQNWRWGNATFRFGPLTMVVCLSLAL